MAQPEPYISRNPGDLITAADWNDLQSQIRQDIDDSITDAKADIKETGVDRADNADRFSNRSDTEWTQELDQRYAAKVHDHEGMSVYRHYIKRFTEKVDEVLLRHELGRFPLVDVYELKPITERAGFEKCKLLFYYGHADADDFKLTRTVYRDRAPVGIPFEPLLAELGVIYEDDDTIEDVLNDMWTAFEKDPNDEIDHCASPWVDDCCEKHRTVEELKRADQWADLWLALKPRKCGMGADLFLESRGDGEASALVAPACRVEIEHVNYETLYVGVNDHWQSDKNGETLPLDLMLLLRA